MKFLISLYRGVWVLGYKVIYGVAIGKGAKIGPHCFFDQSVSIGNHCYIGHHSNIRKGVRIGDFFLCADNVVVAGSDHSWSELGVPVNFSRQPEIPITCIGDDVWIGRNVTVMRGINIGSCSIIGAGSVVTKSIPSGEIWAGVPAKKIGTRFTESMVKDHIKIILGDDK